MRRQSELHVLVTGGSLGSEFLNRYAPALLNRVAASFDSVRITHQVGRHDRVPVERAYDSPSVTARVVNQIQKMDTVYDDVDCVISAGGAITLAELNALSVPTVVVPLEWATHDHQADNAEQFVTGHPDRRWVRETTFGAADLQTWITARLRERVVSARSSQHGLCEAGSVRQTGQVSRQIAEELREVIIAAENPQSP